MNSSLPDGDLALSSPELMDTHPGLSVESNAKPVSKSQSKNFMIDNLLSTPNTVTKQSPETNASGFPWQQWLPTTSRVEQLTMEQNKQYCYKEPASGFIQEKTEEYRVDEQRKDCERNDEAGSSSAEECFGKFEGKILFLEIS